MSRATCYYRVETARTETRHKTKKNALKAFNKLKSAGRAGEVWIQRVCETRTHRKTQLLSHCNNVPRYEGRGASAKLVGYEWKCMRGKEKTLRFRK